MTIDDLDEQAEHRREVFARYGLALYYAQVLEHGLVNALAYSELFPVRRRNVRTREEWGLMVDSFMDRQFEATMGRLIRRLRERTAVPDDLESQLTSALLARNRLAHSFFRDYAQELLTTVGRDKMISDADKCRALFEAADDTLTSVVDPVRRKAGISDEMIADALSAMLSAGNDADGA